MSAVRQLEGAPDLLPPLPGEGWGGGTGRSIERNAEAKSRCPHPNPTCGRETRPPFGQSGFAQAEPEPLASAPEGEGARHEAFQ